MTKVPTTNQPYQRCKGLVRCLRLMKLVEGGASCDLELLAERLGVSTRTIRRDMAALYAAGIAVPWGPSRQKDMAA